MSRGSGPGAAPGSGPGAVPEIGRAVIPLPVLDVPVPGALVPGSPVVGCAATGSCGSSAPLTDPEIAAKVADHPCYNADAHQYYARMHVPVAPGCNIQCNYCNRKFDCANESRPGVTSALLTPEEALAKVTRVANRIAQLRVLGIAGPGEPLANASRTFRTLELVGRHCPDLRLCLSTNGLTLADHVDRIAGLGVDHVTITINMVDPEIGARIYPWIAYRGRRYTGVEAARILGERQLEGLQALSERKILCKVNSVMIPGVNDEHLVEVSRTVRRLGAFLHNVMPLVSAPEHGTHFGLTGQRGPTDRELRELRERCERADGATMSVMRHCRQCRADAVGMLGEDRGAEFDAPGTDAPGTDALGAGAARSDAAEFGAPGYDLAGRREAHVAIERWRAEAARARRSSGIATGTGDLVPGAAAPERTVLVAVATTGGGVVNQHFGRAKEFWIYEAAPRWARFVGIRKVPTSCGGPERCGEPKPQLTAAVELLGDCAAVLCNKIGPQPHGALTAAGIAPVEVHDLIEQAVAAAGARLLGTPAGEKVGGR